MKAEAGWSAAALLSVAAFVGITSQTGGKGAIEGGATPGRGHATQGFQSTTKSPFERGPCANLEEKLQTFLLTPREGIAAPPSCYDERAGKARIKDAKADVDGGKALRDQAAGLRFMIAIVPDPVHTHFSLSFDRQAEAIQQGAQDEGYFYDSSWMPWQTEEPSLIFLADQDKLDDRKKAREDQPGILLFRKTLPQGEEAREAASGSSFAAPANEIEKLNRVKRPGKQRSHPATTEAKVAGKASSYNRGLVVFVVGEEPTSGVHKEQFRNAVDWINALRPQTGEKTNPPRQPVQILGPSSSGSLASLAQLLADKEESQKVAKFYGGESDKTLAIYSGGITSDGAVIQFVRAMKDAGNVRFRSFEESDETTIWRYRSYLAKEGFDISRLAIVSEDETAFGGYIGGAREKSDDPLCGKVTDPKQADEVPTCLYYPRDISALRDAYQKQSIFNAGSTQSSAQTAQHTLSTDLADPAGEQHDSIRNYSGNQTPLSQEAVLQQIVSMLRAHQSQYVVLRSSNPLDQLFLSHYLRLAYPEGRTVIQGADLLLRRESGAATLSGIMTLTTYPLLPWEQHWTNLDGMLVSHSHKVFAQDIAEGTYVATRALLEGSDFDGECSRDPDANDETGPPRAAEFLPPNCDAKPIRDYVAPLWASPQCLVNDWRCAAARRPSSWLSVLGRDGFWPVAALNEATVPPRLAQSGAARIPDWVEWPPMPVSMKICIVAILALAVFHLLCCARPSLTLKPSYRAHFVRIPGWTHPTLILTGSVAITLIPILLAWGYGAMSRNGEPVPHPLVYWLFLPLIWLLAGTATAVNRWLEGRLAPQVEQPQGGVWSTWPPWLLLALYLAATAILYLLVDLSLDHTLNPANRIPTYWRSINLTNGVSPLVPLLALAAGFYCWFWYSLNGLALFGKGRPLLPKAASLEILWPTGSHQFMSMYGGERMGRYIEALCRPFAKRVVAAFAGWFVVLLLMGYLLAEGKVPIRSLGATSYARFYCIGLDLCLSLILANAWQLLKIWFRLRQLLVFLDRLPLRRTMIALKAYSWGSVWKMGGNILDVRYKLFYRQFESLAHLYNSLEHEKKLEDPAWREQIHATVAARAVFADWYSTDWDDWRARDLTALRNFQRSVAEAAGVILAKLLVPRWRVEEKSLVLELSDKKSVVVEIAEGKAVLLEASDAESSDTAEGTADNDDPPRLFRNAEELVCLVYLGFVQNVLGRMRTIVMQIVLLFIAATVSVATYPFDPRPALSGVMVLMFLILGVVLVIVYSQMCRDATLSHVTNTNPGELGAEFWFKLVGFGLGPALGLLAALFPELPGSLLSWLQPGAAALK